MMEMDLYDYQSYMESASNLAMLKLFHDEGVDVVNQIPTKVFMTSVHYGQGEAWEIFFYGLKALFETVESYEYGEDLPVEYEFLDGAENVFVIRDFRFCTALNSSFRDVLEKKMKEVFAHTAVWGKSFVLQDGLLINMESPIMLHPIVKHIVDCKNIAEQIIQKMIQEDEHNHGNHNQDIRSA